jgi:hypothetical protein
MSCFDNYRSEGSKRAEARAEQTMVEVREAMQMTLTTAN